MISSDPRLQVNVAEQLARSIVAAAHAPSPNLVGAMNHGRRSAASAFFNSLLNLVIWARYQLAFTVAPHLQTINYRGRFSRFVGI
jgi:hypothetical protein